MTGQNPCGLINCGHASCPATHTVSEVASESMDTTAGGHNTAGTSIGEGKRPSIDLSALERKTVRGGITRFHCRYFLKAKHEKGKHTRTGEENHNLDLSDAVKHQDQQTRQ